MGLYFYICASLHDIMFMKFIHAIGISIVVLFYCYVMAQHRPNIYVLKRALFWHLLDVVYFYLLDPLLIILFKSSRALLLFQLH